MGIFDILRVCRLFIMGCIWACYAKLWQFCRDSKKTVTRDSSWTVTTGDKGTTQTEHVEEITENGHRQDMTRTKECYPYGHNNDDKEKMWAAGGHRQCGELVSDGQNATDVVKMQRNTRFSVHSSKTADAMIQSDKEAEKKLIDIASAIVDSLGRRSGMGKGD